MTTMSESQSQEIHSTESDGGTHHYENAKVTVSDGNAWFESKAYKNFMAFCRAGLFIVAIGSFVFGAYIYQDRMNAQSSSSVEKNASDLKAFKEVTEQRQAATDAKIKEVESKTLTAAQFQAYFDGLNQRLARIENKLDQAPSQVR